MDGKWQKKSGQVFWVQFSPDNNTLPSAYDVVLLFSSSKDLHRRLKRVKCLLLGPRNIPGYWQSFCSTKNAELVCCGKETIKCKRKVVHFPHSPIFSNFMTERKRLWIQVLSHLGEAQNRAATPLHRKESVKVFLLFLTDRRHHGTPGVSGGLTTPWGLFRRFINYVISCYT